MSKFVTVKKSNMALTAKSSTSMLYPRPRGQKHFKYNNMRIAATHPIKRMIQHQYNFLLSMLWRFPYLLEEWVKKQEEEVEQMAKSVAGGDYEVYTSVYSSEISRVDTCYYEEELFNQSMLIMVYSYYESSLLRLARENNITTSRVSSIAKKFGIRLNEELLRIADFLYSTIRPLRNQLCHNNSGTLFERSDEIERGTIEELIKKEDISIDDGRITFINKDFIKQILEDEYKLLIKLAEICGYKTELYTS